jgi:hypothetical protein
MKHRLRAEGRLTCLPIRKNGKKGAAMKKIATLVLTVFTVSLTGCGKQELDCEKLGNQQEREQCAHKASTDPRGPDTLPTNPKKW